MITDFVPTDEQRDIAAAAAQRDGPSLIIRAFAGAAKTSTLVLAAKGLRVPTLSLAFNVAIKDEMKKRMPQNFSVQTLNGLGYAAIMRAMPHVRFDKPDEKKLGKLITASFKREKFSPEEGQWDGTRQLVRKAMEWGMVPGDEGASPILPDTEENWKAAGEDVGMAADDFTTLYPFAWEVLRSSNEAVGHGSISYDDQVYYSNCVRGTFPKFPVLMVDEAQDLSPLNHSMIAKAIRPDGRLIVVGDERQAIYAFRGADANSMVKLEGLRAVWGRLPLTMTFRCPKLVVARQQGHAPGFRAAEANLPGVFYKLEERDEDGQRTWGWEDLAARLPNPDASIAILCRNNGPLISMAFRLIRHRIAVTMLGRDIGQGLIALSRKLFPDDHAPQERMLAELGEWERNETGNALSLGQEEKVAGIADKAESLRAVLTFATTAKELRLALQELFSRDSGRVTLASIHKAKGLEWDVVVHLDPWRIPSKWAREAADLGDDRALTQEFNLRYVAETRTRNVLIEANEKEFGA